MIDSMLLDTTASSKRGLMSVISQPFRSRSLNRDLPLWALLLAPVLSEIRDALLQWNIPSSHSITARDNMLHTIDILIAFAAGKHIKAQGMLLGFKNKGELVAAISFIAWHLLPGLFRFPEFYNILFATESDAVRAALQLVEGEGSNYVADAFELFEGIQATSTSLEDDRIALTKYLISYFNQLR